ncbi:MAG: hypothetical protein Q8P67_09715, partial [archaeon]|nr:hypothetical protein [archaeon]
SPSSPSSPAHLSLPAISPRSLFPKPSFPPPQPPPERPQYTLPQRPQQPPPQRPPPRRPTLQRLPPPQQNPSPPRISSPCLPVGQSDHHPTPGLVQDSQTPHNDHHEKDLDQMQDDTAIPASSPGRPNDGHDDGLLILAGAIDDANDEADFLATLQLLEGPRAPLPPCPARSAPPPPSEGSLPPSDGALPKGLRTSGRKERSGRRRDKSPLVPLPLLPPCPCHLLRKGKKKKRVTLSISTEQRALLLTSTVLLSSTSFACLSSPSKPQSSTRSRAPSEMPRSKTVSSILPANLSASGSIPKGTKPKPSPTPPPQVTDPPLHSSPSSSVVAPSPRTSSKSHRKYPLRALRSQLKRGPQELVIEFQNRSPIELEMSSEELLDAWSALLAQIEAGGIKV